MKSNGYTSRILSFRSPDGVLSMYADYFKPLGIGLAALPAVNVIFGRLWIAN
jgi:hypothetical protein